VLLETLNRREPEPGPLRQAGLGQVGVEPQLLRAAGDVEGVKNASKMMYKPSKRKLTHHFRCIAWLSHNREQGASTTTAIPGLLLRVVHQCHSGARK